MVRRELNQAVSGAFHDQPETRAAVRRALERILDMELAIMLHTYRAGPARQQARVERLSAFGQLVGSIGHDLRNPLGVIETSLFILRGRTGSDERIKNTSTASAIKLGVKRHHHQPARHDRTSRSPWERVKLDEIVERAADSVQRPEAVSYLSEGVGGRSRSTG